MRLRFVPWLVLLGLSSSAALHAVEYALPNASQRTAAIGSLSAYETKLRRAFRDTGEYQPKKEPGGFDWLAQHQEPGQTYDQYLASRPNVPNATRGKLYILPIGAFDKATSPDLDLLKRYTAAYYHPMPVVLLPVITDNEVTAGSRINSLSGKKQWKSTDLLNQLPKRLPADAYALLAVTMTDLYPDEQWNFVFGQASLQNRVGVFSFARYHPSWDGKPADDSTRAIVLRRATKVLTHEMGHMFGIRHCIYYECNMNGVNHLDEADATPMQLCPVCTRKLHHAIRFDPLTREKMLGQFYADNGMPAEQKWSKTHADALEVAK